MLTVATIVVVAASLVQAGERKLNPYTPGENGVTAPKVIAETAQAIPLPEGRGAGAVLTVSAVVRKDGTVADVRVIDSSVKGAGLEESAVATIRGWRFEPGTWRGSAVDTVKTMRIHLGDQAAAAAAASAQPVASEIRLPAFDPLFTALRLPGDRSPQTQYPDEDPQYRKPAVVDKTTCAFGENCLHEKTPGTKEQARLVSMPSVPASQK
jgi:TonB family protein